MAKYFSVFPKVLYSFDDYKSGLYVTNILNRFKFDDNLKYNISSYFLHLIKEYETPEIIADKYYGSPYRFWMILLMNDIIDPQYQWPLHTISLNQYIDSKYMSNSGSNTAGSGLYWARSNIHSYYKNETITIPNVGQDLYSYKIDANTYSNLIESYDAEVILPDNTVITIDTEKTTKSYYEYELEENENKREIKILRKEFVAPIENELRRIFSNA
jgi:hypothetical protein